MMTGNHIKKKGVSKENASSSPSRNPSRHAVVSEQGYVALVKMSHRFASLRNEVCYPILVERGSPNIAVPLAETCMSLRRICVQKS